MDSQNCCGLRGLQLEREIIVCGVCVWGEREREMDTGNPYTSVGVRSTTRAKTSESKKKWKKILPYIGGVVILGLVVGLAKAKHDEDTGDKKKTAVAKK